MYQGKNVKVHVEEVKASMMANFKADKVQEVLASFMKSKNVLDYSITNIAPNTVSITIIYED